jgi:hypothetical protein
MRMPKEVSGVVLRASRLGSLTVGEEYPIPNDEV